MVRGMHFEWVKKGGTKRGHCQRNLDLEITASVTICQVRNLKILLAHRESRFY